MAMSGVIFFYDIPVYRLPEDRYYAERDRYIDLTIYGTNTEDRKSRQAFYESKPDNKINFEHHLHKSFGGPWIFNEVVGYIRLHFLGTQVRGELWMVDRKRIVKSRKKLILLQSEKVSYEEQIPFNASNEQVYRAILVYLNRAKKELEGRVVDTTLFERLGQFVDWNALRRVG